MTLSVEIPGLFLLTLNPRASEMTVEEVFTESVAHCLILNEAAAILGLIDGFCPVEIKSHS